MTAGRERRDVTRRMLAAATLAPPVLAGIAGCTRGPTGTDTAKLTPRAGDVAAKAPAAPALPAVAAATSAPQTVTGPPVQQQYGPITVTVTVTGDRITDVNATAGVTDAVSVMINNDAIPKLNAEVLAAQAATSPPCPARRSRRRRTSSRCRPRRQAGFHPGGSTTPTTGAPTPPSPPTSGPKATTTMPMGPMPTATTPTPTIPTPTIPTPTIPAVPTTAAPVVVAPAPADETSVATGPEAVVATPTYTG